ncbi:hypothetical protein KVR01_005755 [Diaporthe batatas]|uniref:uncharacterized protein n=1 Tax=Diaporthe batatas TaxID=748121 RepID=UPI001D053F32|nr:uncharacterized protein KVR01_005755 [Diaporthe batatas]KAG8163837.1 hypothetical protein KVR01_005755 [Diaporthe batatas]
MIRTFSPVMRSLVQAAVWNYVSCWLVVVMVTNTVVYNGFATNNLSNDSVLRLVLVGLDFIFVNADAYRSDRVDKESKCYLTGLENRAPEEVWATLGLELFGKSERLHTYHPIYRINFREVTKRQYGTERRMFWDLHDKRCQAHVREWYNGKTGPSAFDKITKPVREAELKAYEKAAEAVLEKTLANTAAMLGICLATALAPWTSTDNTDATASQLGSYALLLTISTGFFAITGIVGQLQNATRSARTLLKLQERTIYAAATDTNTANSPLHDGPPMSFTEGIQGQLAVTSLKLWKQASLGGKMGSIFLGPALTLIPRLHRDCTDRANIYFKVGKEDFAMKTDFEESPGCSPRLFRPAPQPTSKDAELEVV